MKQSSIDLYSRILTAYQTEKRITHLGKSLKVAGKTIKKALKWGGVDQIDVIKAGLIERKYPINHNYFSVIDSHEKAYYLGLLYADGTVVVRNETTRGFNISLTESDAYILNILNQKVKYGKKMMRHVYRENRGRPCIHLYAWSKQLCNDLIRHGCGPRKSLTLEFPKPGQYFDECFMGTFLRGYFDGDGHAGFARPRLTVRVTSSHAFCKGMIDYLKTKHDIACSFNNRGVYGDVVLTQKLGKMKLYRLMYGDTSFPLCLERKKQAFEGVFEHLEARSRERKLNAKQQATLELGRIVYQSTG